VSSLPTRFPLSECGAGACHAIRSVLSEGLARVEWEDGTLVARSRAAVQWKNVPGGWEIQINPSQRWSDGIGVDAQHFLDAWESRLAQCRRNKDVKHLFFIHNAKAFCDGTVPFSEVGAKRLGPNSLFVQTTVGATALPFRFAHPITWPSRKRFEGDFPPSLGPFRIESSGPTSLKLTRNPLYLPEPVALGGIELQLISSPGTRVQAFFDGEIDFVDEIPLSYSSQLASSDALLSVPLPRTLVLSFGNLPGAAAKPHRVALVRAYDAQEMEKLVRPSRAPGPAIPFEAKFFQPLTYGPESARKLWSDPTPPSLRLFMARTLDKEAREVMENLRAQWLKNLSLKSEISKNALHSLELREHEWDIYDPSGGLDTGTKAQFSEVLLYPLYRRARYVLRRRTFDGVSPLPDGGWDFSKTSIQQAE